MVISKEKRGRRKDLCEGGVENLRRKKMRPAPESAGRSDFFDGLPDDLVVCILCKLSSSAGSPSDFTNVLITCKRLNGLGLHPLVLGKVSPKALAVRAKKWSESAHRFLKLCTEAGNIKACYILGMRKVLLLSCCRGERKIRILLESTLKEIRARASVLDMDPKSTVGGGVEDMYGEDRATEDQLVTPWSISIARKELGTHRLY